jgi:hypothetical protein
MARQRGLGLARVVGVAGALALVGAGCRCAKAPDPAGPPEDAALEAAPADDASGLSTHEAGEPAGGLSAPIAAARSGADVVVAGLDVPSRSIRVQRISASDAVVAERMVFEGVAWSSDSDLKVIAASDGVAVTWRGLRGGKLVRQLLVLGADLAPRGEAVDVAAGSCATQDALWFTDGKRVHRRPWSGSATHSELPKDKDAALVCGAHRAFALLDEDEGTTLLALGGGGEADGGKADAGGASASSTIVGAAASLSVLKESEFGEDEQRERAEFTVGDDLGVVRLATSGAVALREIRAGALGPLRKLKTAIGRDDDVVAVDASLRVVVIVFTEDAGEACAAEGGAMSPSTRVKALRVDRATLEESTVELSPGACGREVGPFFTGALGDAVSVAWVERVPVAGKARAPIAGLAHRTVNAAGAPGELVRAEQPADALVDAGCDGAHCYAVALARRTGMDAMIPGLARVLRY